MIVIEKRIIRYTILGMITDYLTISFNGNDDE